MKNAIIRKILAAAAAIVVVASMTGCFGAPAAPQNPQPAPSAPTSAADVSGSDVSGSDVSGSDVVILDDATASVMAIEGYFNGFNTGNGAALADVTCSPAVISFLEGNGKTKQFVADNFAASIEEMKKASGGCFYIDYDYTIADATEDQLNQLKTELEAISVGSGEKVEAVRVCTVSMKAQSVASASDVTSSGDLVSGADVTTVESSDMELRLYKYEGKWYVFSV